MESRGSLRVRILLTFLGGLALASTMALSIFYRGGTRVLERWVIDSNQHLAMAVKRHIEEALSRGMAGGVHVAARLHQATGDRAAQERILSSFLEFGELYSNGYLFDAAGKLELAVYRSDAPGTTKVGEDYHRYTGPFPSVADRVMASGQPAFTPLFLSGTGRAQLTYVIPVGPSGERPRGLLSLALYAVSERVNGWIEGLAPSRQGYVVVLDPAGKIVAVSGEVPPSMKKPGGPSPIVLPDAVDRLAMTRWIDGREDLVIAERIGDASLSILIGSPRAVAYEPLDALRSPAALACLSVLVLGMIAAFLLTRRILGPLQALLDGIHQVESGVFSHRIPVGQDDELGRTIEAFNRMSERLHRDRLIQEIWQEVRED